MSAIRVTGLTKHVRESDLKVYFSKPENGGGLVSKIYFPLTNDDAVILFKDKQTASQVISISEHEVVGEEVSVCILPTKVFSSIKANVDMAVSLLIQSIQGCQDHLQYIIGVNLEFTEGQECVISGDIFQIEMAWVVIGEYLQQQERIHCRASKNGEKAESVAKESAYSSRQPRPTHNGSLTKKEQLSQRNNRRNNTEPYWSTETETPKDDLQSLLSNRNWNQMESLETKSLSSMNHDKKHRSMDSSNQRLLPFDDSPDQTSVLTLNQRPITSPGAEWSYENKNSEIETQVNNFFQSSQRTPSSDIFTNSDQLGDYNTPSLTGATFPGTDGKSFNYRSLNRANSDYLTSVSAGRDSVRAFPSHMDDSSDEDTFGRGSERFADANSTFENFSSLRRTSEEAKFEKIPVNKVAEAKHTILSHTRHQKSAKTEEKPTAFTTVDHQNTIKKEAEISSLDRLLASNFSSLEPQLEALRLSQRAALSIGESPVSKFTFNVGTLRVTVYQGNITAVDTVAIVNAANVSLANGAGVAGAIARAASPTMQLECDQYIKKYGIMGTAEIMHTRAGGKLNEKVIHILHAVGPIWLENLPDRCTYELVLTYLNVFKYAEKLWIPSITLPCISSGVFGSPLDVSIKCFLDGILIFHSQMGDNIHLKDIFLVNNDPEGVVTSIALLKSLLDVGQDHITAEAIDRFTKLQEKRRSASNKFSKTIDLKSGVKDDISSSVKSKTENGHVNETSRARRRSSSLSRLVKSKSSSSEKNTNPETVRKVQVTGNSSSVEKKPSSARSPRPISTKSTTSSRIGKEVPQETQSPRQPPALKQALVKTSPTGTGAKPKTKNVSQTSVKNTPLKAGSHVLTSEATSQVKEMPRSEFSHSLLNGDKKDKWRHAEPDGMYSLPVNIEGSGAERIPHCKICYGRINDRKVLYKCGHVFCTECIENQFRKNGPKCPQCGEMYTSAALHRSQSAPSPSRSSQSKTQIRSHDQISYGNTLSRTHTDSPKEESPGRSLLSSTVIHSSRPPGIMSHMTRRNISVPGYEYCEGAIEIQYDIPSGKLPKNHSKAGYKYNGAQHKAYLPNSVDGRTVLKLLKMAFESDLVFRLSSRGTVEWCIPHKTSISGGPPSGYPDSQYLQKVKDDLSRKGIKL